MNAETDYLRIFKLALRLGELKAQAEASIAAKRKELEQKVVR